MKSFKIKKLVAAALVALTIGSVFETGAYASWKQDWQNNWSWTENGRNAVGWKQVDGTWYNFDSAGKMKTGWANDNGTWYYLQSSGAMKTGWINDNGTWYFAEVSGAMKTGVIEVDGKVYCLAQSGAMQTGNVVMNGVTYTFDASGSAIGNNIPTPTLMFTSSGTVITKSNDGNSSGDENTSNSGGSSSGGGGSSSSGNGHSSNSGNSSNGGSTASKTFQDIIDSQYSADMQITFNDYKADGVIKPKLNFTPGTETVTINGEECIVKKDIYVTLNGMDAYISGDLQNGYTVTGSGDVNVRASISIFSKTTGKLYYVTPKTYTITV